jgi:dienelactone hydrolase
MLRHLFCVLAAVLATTAFAAGPDGPGARPNAPQKIAYDVGHTTFESLLIGAGHGGADRPSLLMVPNWLGINEAAIAHARELAGDRYVVLLVDMYGASLRPDDFEAAGKASSSVLSDRGVARERIRRALDALREVEGVDDARIAAVGFCFGGTVALELARSGADLAGVVSIHGNPGPVAPPPATGSVKASVLVLHGAADFFVPAENLRAFKAEMDAAQADWTFVSFGGAKHCFAEAGADNRPPGCVYHPVAAKRAYAMLDQYLGEWFAR